MSKNGKRRIVIEVDEQQYETLKRLKALSHSRSWVDLLFKCLDNAAIISELEEMRSEIKNLNNLINEVLSVIKEE